MFVQALWLDFLGKAMASIDQAFVLIIAPQNSLPRPQRHRIRWQNLANVSLPWAQRHDPLWCCLWGGVVPHQAQIYVSVAPFLLIDFKHVKAAER